MAPRLLIKCPCYALLELAVRIRDVPSVETETVQMNHQLKIFRDVIFGPVFSASVVAQIVQPNLIYGKERQPDVLQPSLSFSERANTTALLDSLASQEDGMPHQRRVTSKDAAKQEVPLVQSIGVNRKHVDKIRLATLVIQCLQKKKNVR